MSWATCYLDDGCNNIHFDKPPLVSDGRFYTSYISSEAMNEKIKATIPTAVSDTVVTDW
jgi:hypothetical protein